jgi:hypothetical protein
MIELRGASKQQAAAYAGCETLSAFNDWIGRGIMPSTKHDHLLLLRSCRRMMALRGLSAIRRRSNISLLSVETPLAL